MLGPKSEHVRRLAAAAAVVVLSGLSQAALAQGNCEYPRALLVVDRSSSMTGTIGGVTKWNIAEDAINTMTGNFGGGIDFGLMIYPGPSGTGANGIEGDVPACFGEPCSVNEPQCTTGEVVVGIGRNTTAQIRDVLTQDPRGGAYTPTWQSLQAAAGYAPLGNVNYRRFVILVTDGWQCCGVYTVNGTQECTNAASERYIAVEKVTQLKQQGVTTYVVGFGASVDATMLNRAANAAGTARPGCDSTAANPCYYQASNHAQLSEFLDSIARQISAETCDGLDNDCDGQVDGIVQECNTACGPGLRTCENGRWGDCDAQAPLPESCNGEDDDCDGRIDEDIPPQACNTACGPGTATCVGGEWVNCTARQPVPEECDGLIDDDCDGQIDEGCVCTEGDTRQCGSAVGTCRKGVQTCTNGSWGDCVGGVGPVAEVCDGKDNDCDGTVDSFTRDCSTNCGPGTQVCLNGEWRACNAPQPSNETCDGEADDCDGQIDEGLTRDCSNDCGDGVETCVDGDWEGCTARQPTVGDACGDGIDGDCDGETDEGCVCENGDTQVCGVNRGECTQGEQTCANGVWGECVGGRQPQVEQCDGKDNDCDGQTDEGTSQACENDCGQGVRECVDGELKPCTVPDPPAEVCDGLDNDCDGVQDDGNLCTTDPDRDRCFCGACTGRCLQGECDDGAQCIDGYCIIDNCPEGYVCFGTVCVPGESGEGEGEGAEGEGEGDGGEGEGEADGKDRSLTGGAAIAGCECNTAAPGGSLALGLPLLLLAGLLIRSRRPR